MIEKSNRQYLEEIKSLRRQMAYFEQQKSEFQNTIEEMKQSEKLFRDLAENAPDWIFWLDTDDRLVYISPSVKRVTGHDPEDFKKDTKLLYKMIHPEDRSAFDDHLRFARKSKASTEEEFRIIRKDKKTRWISHLTQPVYDDEGQYTGIVASNRDITDSKTKDDGSLESEIRYRLLTENISDVIWTMDPTLRPTYVSPSVLQLLGYTVEEAMEQNLRVALTPQSWLKFNEVWSTRMNEERTGKSKQDPSLSLELEYRRKDDSTVWTQSCFTLRRNENGKIVEIIAVNRNIAQILESRQNLIAQVERIRQNECQMKAILDAVTEGIYLQDADGRLLYANETTARRLGTDLETLLAKGQSEFIPQAIEAKRRQYFQNAQKANKPVQFQDELLGRTIANSVYPVAGEDGKATGLAIFSQDITDLKSAEAERQECKRKLAETERLLNLIIHLTPNRIYWKDKRSVYLGGNRLFARDAGREKPEDLIGDTDRNMVWRDRADRIREDDLAVMNGGESRINCEELQTTSDGEATWISTTKIPLTDSAGRTIGVIGSYSNITESKITLEKLKAAEKELQDMQKQLQENQDLLRESDRKLKSTQNQLQESIKELWENKSQLSEHDKTLLEDQKRLQDLEKQLKTYQNQLNENEKLSEASQNILQTLEEQLRDTQRKLSENEKELQESEQRLQSVLEASTEAIYLIDIEGRVLYANQTTAKLLNTNLETLLKDRNIHDFIPSSISEKLKKCVLDVHKTGRPSKFEEELFGRTILQSLHPVLDEKGKVNQTAVFAVDITDRKSAEAAVEQSRHHTAGAHRMLKQILDTIPLRIFWKDQDSVYLGANALFARDVGKDNPESLIGETDQNLLTPQLAQRYHQDDREVIDSGKTRMNYTETYTTPEGRKIWHRMTKAPIRDDNGRTVGVMGIYDDITEQKEAEDAVVESAMRYRSLFENNRMPMLLIDPEHEAILDANDAAVHFYGWSRAELTRKKISDINTLSAGDVTKMMKLAIARKSNHVIFKHKRADGSIRDVEVFSSILQFQGKPVLCAMVYDITNRIQMEGTLRQTDKLDSLGLLAGGIAHDFNNLMTIVQGHIDVALLTLPKEEVACQSLQAAQDAVEKTRAITNRFITFSKGGIPQLKVMRINKLLAEAAKNSLKSTPIDLSLDIPAGLWPVEVDQNQINQCFGHLVDNAREAMPDGGSLNIRVENVEVTEAEGLPLAEGPYLKITLEDSGVGIAAEHLTSIFDPYFTTKPMGKDKGLGLGLAVCHSVLKKHGGYITVQSELGRGAIFSLYLPANPDAVIEESPDEAETAHAARRILIMDDNTDIQKILQIYLEKLGFDVTGVTEGQDAIHHYKEAQEAGAPFNVVFMEISVKRGLGGEATLAKLKTIDPDVRAVAILSDYGDSRSSKFLDQGFKNVLGKPFRLEDMTKILNSILEP